MYLERNKTMNNDDCKEFLNGDISILKYKNNDGTYNMSVLLDKLYADKMVEIKIPKVCMTNDEEGYEILCELLEIPKKD
jgi:hypothetical protein